VPEALQDPELLRDFLVEAGELLEGVDAGLVQLESTPEDKELLNRVFRGFHTIKGGAGFLGAPALVDLCHRTETLFDHFRSGKLAFGPEVMDHILAATGEVRRMFEEMAGGMAPTAAPASLLAAITAAAEGKAAPSPPARQVPQRSGPQSAEPDWQSLLDQLLGKAAPAKPQPKPAAKPVAPAPVENTIKVDTARFDQILNLSGELGLARNRLAFLKHRLASGDPDALHALDAAVNRLGALVGDLQGVVMKARMQPIGRVLQKYARVARDLSRSLGKEVELVLEGEETEVDKTILEQLSDPLVHLVRNAVDHGIETPDQRVAAGKPRAGTIVISARQAGDRILIEIRDDGKGMSAEKLRASAISKGVITADEAATLDERQSLNLIFLPGFSTKTEISDVSGRGVGMDVVKTNITRLKGRIDLASKPGDGSRVTIVLPLTLAILPVLLLRSGKQVYAIPLSVVREVIPLDRKMYQEVSGGDALSVRGEVLPILPLSRLLNSEQSGGTTGIVVTIADRPMVICCDGVIGQDEVMVKPLEGIKPRGIAGATMSGEGVLVLVLELHELIEMA